MKVRVSAAAIGISLGRALRKCVCLLSFAVLEDYSFWSGPDGHHC